ncbi:hypothetical protein Trydic_g7689 [Trypoxylus dichotomus]
MHRLLILSLFLTTAYAGSITHDVDEGESSSSLEIHHGDKHDYGYAFGDSHSSGGHGGSYDDGDQSGFDENQGGGENFGHQDYGSQDGNDDQDGFGGNFHGNYGGYGGGYDDGEGGGSEDDGHKNY